MSWKYGMILVEIADDGEETCELVELYDNLFELLYKEYIMNIIKIYKI